MARQEGFRRGVGFGGSQPGSVIGRNRTLLNVPGQLSNCRRSEWSAGAGSDATEMLYSATSAGYSGPQFSEENGGADFGLFRACESMLLAAAALAIVVVVFVVVAYNGLVRLRVQSDSAWADIDVQLKRRHDLIPNLVETVKGYAAHESSTFEKVTEARAQALSARNPAARGQAEGTLTAAISGLFALAENYPQLRAVKNFSQLQAQISEIEDNIQLARRYYNAVVRDLNIRIAQFPTNLIASLFSFRPREFFEMAVSERESPEVRFESPGA